MTKIKVKHFSIAGPYFYVIDEQGKIWKRAINGGVWQSDGELPEEK